MSRQVDRIAGLRTVQVHRVQTRQAGGQIALREFHRVLVVVRDLVEVALVQAHDSRRSAGRWQG